jgi:DNA-binding SARP family transcriptional activator
VRLAMAEPMGVERGTTTLPLVLRGRRERLALAFLVMERRRPVSRHELADLLWPDALPASWEAGLRSVVSGLRSALSAATLDAEIVRPSPGCYQLHLPEDCRVDLDEAAADLRRAEAALATEAWEIAGRAASAARQVTARPFLPEADCDWVENLHRSLRARHLRALEVVAEAQLRLGQFGEAKQAAEELLALEPWREVGYVLLIRAEADAGNRGGVLAAFERCRAALHEHLGIRPSAQAEQLYRASRRDDARPARAHEELHPFPLEALVEGQPLVGRRRELERLAVSVAEAAKGSARLVLVTGPTGVGKTHLAAEAAREARAEGHDVWFGRCEPHLPVPYGPFVDIVRLLLRESLDGCTWPLSRLAPDLVPAAMAQAPVADDHLDRYLLFEAVVDFLARRAADRSAVVVLDDLGSCPPTGLHLLLHLLRRRSDAPLCVIATDRGIRSYAGGESRAARVDLQRLSGTDVLDLRGLSRAEIAILARQTMPGEDVNVVVRRVQSLSSGNPLYAVTALRQLARDGNTAVVPGTDLRELVSVQLQSLSPVARMVVEAASVLADRATPRLLVATCLASSTGWTVADLERGLDEAVSASLLVTDGSQTVQVAHGVVRETVYGGLSSLKRAELHLAAGREVQRTFGEGPDRLPDLVVHFCESAGLSGTEPALRYVMALGELSEASLDYNAAAATYQRGVAMIDAWAAHDIPSRCRLRRAWAGAQEGAGRFAAADACLLEVAELARVHRLADELARAALAYGGPWVQRRRTTQRKAIDLLHEAMAMLAPEEVPLRTRVAARLEQLRSGTDGGS